VQIPDLAQSPIDPARLMAEVPHAAPAAEPPSDPLSQPGQPPTGGAASGATESQPGAAIRGTVRLAEGKTAPDQGVLFVIVRKPGMRPPIAALRLPITKFPMEFEVGPENAIAMGGVRIPFEAPLEVSARIDLDGNALTRSAGELEGSAGEVAPGATGVEIVLGD
jgi:hypothetical protein